MYYTLAAYISQRVIVYSIVLLRWSPGVSFAVPFLIYLRDLCCQCRFWQRVWCSVLLRGVSELLVPRTRLAIMQRRAFYIYFIYIYAESYWKHHTFAGYYICSF